NPALDFSGLWRAGRGLATVPPGDEESENEVQAAEAAGQKPVAPGRGRENGETAEEHETKAHDGKDGDGESASGHDAGAVKQQPGCGQGRWQAGTKQQKSEKGAGHQGRRESEN